MIKALGSVGGTGAIVAVLLYILYLVTSRIVERFIAAIDRIATKVDAVDDNVKALDAKVTSALNWRHPDESGRQRAPLGDHTPERISR